mgnify:CR=1 FL=1
MKKVKQGLLKELFDYDPETGVFTRIKSNSNRWQTGVVAGSNSSNRYKLIFISGKNHMAHRMAWLYVHGSMPDGYIDHINGIRDDNRMCNLRVVTRTENNRNRCTNKNNTSGVNGVSWCKRTKSWLVTICIKSKMKYLGRFKDKDEAIKKRRKVELDCGYHENHGRKQQKAIQ